MPHHERVHHALPLGGGWWRGPAPASGRCEHVLAGLGIEAGGPLPDSSWRLRLARDGTGPDLRAAAADPGDPAARAHWIAARLHAAREAWRAEPPVPEFMAVLNLTPDSFSDGGELLRPGALEQAARERLEEGARWLDLGAESTRPGARPVPAEAQLERLLPALEALRGVPARLSVDTRCAQVARACLDAGAVMVNDVSALSDPEMGPLIAERGCLVVLMHMRGTPEDMAQRAIYRMVLGEVADELAARAAHALRCGIRPEQIYLDPGLGFAKNAEQSLELVARLGALRALGFPLLVGPSRKSFLAGPLGGKPPAERDFGTAGAAALCAAHGSAILRLHRGVPAWEAVRAAAAAAAAARRGQGREAGHAEGRASPLPAAEEARW